MKTEPSHREGESTLEPTFLRELGDPACRTVLLCGCGGGFDFVHGMLLYPELMRLGKRVVVSSYSFGNVENIGMPYEVAFDQDGVVVKLITAASAADPVYPPEIHLASFLDTQSPAQAPHSIYASYARDFHIGSLRRFYEQLVEQHSVDTVILMDGGTDSLLVGDEADLGDPIEDLTSVAAVTDLSVERTLLFNVGFGVDRFNGVSDASSMRAVAELTRAGGYRGSIGIEPNSPGARFYAAAVDHIYERQRFRSAATGFVLSAIDGAFGGAEAGVPAPLSQKLTERDTFFVWPLMAQLFCFDVRAVAQRSLIPGLLAGTKTQSEALLAIAEARRALAVRDEEPLPNGPAYVGEFGIDYTQLTVRRRSNFVDDNDLEELPSTDE